MAAEKPNTTSRPTSSDQHINYEAILTGVVALANLFGNCVEAFNLIHPAHQKWDKDEQLLLATLGIQQARLLIWGDVVGITSPPANVTDRAIPKHPSAAYPDLKEPTFFGARDGRLDEAETRQQIENAISAIVDRSAGTSREEMMSKYGLKPPKTLKFNQEYQPALDTNRLEAFRERYELLKEVAETYAQINSRRQSSIVSSSWTISDPGKFAGFIKLTQEKIDFLINLMDVKERVDRGMRMDIRALGWHLSADRIRVALDVSKLKLIQESCKDEYPEYLVACKQALDNVDRERAENVTDYNPYTTPNFAPLVNNRAAKPPPSAFAPVPFSRSGRGSISAASGAFDARPPAAPSTSTNGNGTSLSPEKREKRGSLFGSLFKRKSTTSIDKDRSHSIASSRPADPPRSLSDAGPTPSSTRPESSEFERYGLDQQPAQEDPAGNQYVRSKSVGDILDAPINSADEEEARQRLEKLRTNESGKGGPVVAVDPPRYDQDQIDPLSSTIEAHDSYVGLGRQDTKPQWYA